MMLRDTGPAVSYNPVAGAGRGNAIAPATTMAAIGIRFEPGTDGARGDGFRLIDAVELAQRLGFGLAVGDFSCGGGWTCWAHATSGAASAVGPQGGTGQIVVGR